MLLNASTRGCPGKSSNPLSSKCPSSEPGSRKTNLGDGRGGGRGRLKEQGSTIILRTRWIRSYVHFFSYMLFLKDRKRAPVIGSLGTDGAGAVQLTVTLRPASLDPNASVMAGSRSPAIFILVKK